MQAAVVEHARSGATVVLGPLLPTHDARLQPDTTLVDALDDPASVTVDGTEVGRRFPCGDGAVVHLDPFTEPRTLGAALDTAGVLAPSTDDERLDVAVHRHLDDPRRHLVYVANPTGSAITAHVDPVPGATVGDVGDVWRGEKVDADGTGWDVDLPPYDIGIYTCTLDEQETR